jgi:predicted ABC-type transport system involved in lysophospholipase L1 biosynthesis ATPase subunit
MFRIPLRFIRATFAGTLLEPNRGLGIRLIVVTHNERLSARLDRVCRLEGGKRYNDATIVTA